MIHPNIQDPEVRRDIIAKGLIWHLHTAADYNTKAFDLLKQIEPSDIKHDRADKLTLGFRLEEAHQTIERAMRQIAECNAGISQTMVDLWMSCSVMTRIMGLTYYQQYKEEIYCDYAMIGGGSQSRVVMVFDEHDGHKLVRTQSLVPDNFPFYGELSRVEQRHKEGTGPGLAKNYQAKYSIQLYRASTERYKATMLDQFWTDDPAIPERLFDLPF